MNLMLVILATLNQSALVIEIGLPPLSDAAAIQNVKRPLDEEVRSKLSECMNRGVLILRMVAVHFWTEMWKNHRAIKRFTTNGGVFRHAEEGTLLPGIDFTDEWVVKCDLRTFSGTSLDFRDVMDAVTVVELTLLGQEDRHKSTEYLRAVRSSTLQRLTVEGFYFEGSVVGSFGPNFDELSQMMLHGRFEHNWPAEPLRLPNLESLKVQSQKLANLDMDNLLKNANSLKSIRMSTVKIDRRVIQSIPGEVTELRLDECLIEGKSLEALRHLKFLELLSLKQSSGVTNADLGPIGKLATLIGLDLTAAEVTSEGVSMLGGLEQLKTIVLRNCRKVDDSAIPTILQLSSLYRVSIEGTKISHVGIETLKTQLPEAEVSTSPNNRWGGAFAGEELNID